MNRDIKFRAWDSKFNVMLEDFAIYRDGYMLGLDLDYADSVYPEGEEYDDGVHFGAGDDWVFVMADFHLMQFTGLTDKNGVPIYEGDVIHNWQGGWNVVVWKAPGFEATVSADQSSMYSLEWWAEAEVIGNIYEHPELLKQD